MQLARAADLLYHHNKNQSARFGMLNLDKVGVNRTVEIVGEVFVAKYGAVAVVAGADTDGGGFEADNCLLAVDRLLVDPIVPSSEATFQIGLKNAHLYSGSLHSRNLKLCLLGSKKQYTCNIILE